MLACSRRIVRYCLAVLILSYGPVTLSLADEITIVADEWPPYNGKPESDLPGYGIEIAKRIFEAYGHKVVYKTMPWARAIVSTREGKHMAIIGAYKSDAPDFVFPEEEFGFSQDATFVTAMNSWRYTGPDSLKTVKLGLIKDYSYSEEIDCFIKANPNNVDYSFGEDPLKSSVQKLMQGRVDVVLGNDNVMKLKLRQIGLTGQVVNAGYTHEGKNVYLAFSPRMAHSQEYAARYSQGVRKLKASGELDAILAKYGLTYWK